MTFIAMIYGVVYTEFLKHEHTAYAEQIFLLDTVFPVTAIQFMCNAAVKLTVHVKVGIHQIELHAAHINTPHVRIDYASGERHFKNHRVAFGIKHLLYRELVEVLRLIVGYLLAVNRQSLCEISVTVKETYGSHIHTTVRGFFYIVAGKHTKTAGIYLQAVAQTVFHGEI